MSAPTFQQAIPVTAAKGGETNMLIVALDVLPTEVADARVLVVAPALNSWLRRWVSDEDTARRRAAERVVTYIERLERSGIHAEGRVGDADPVLAIADALPTFPADEILIAAGPEDSTAEELAARARELFALPTSLTAGGAPMCRVAHGRNYAAEAAAVSRRSTARPARSMGSRVRPTTNWVLARSRAASTSKASWAGSSAESIDPSA